MWRDRAAARYTSNNTKQIIFRDGNLVIGKKEREEQIKDKIINYSMDSYEFAEDYFKNYNQFIEYLVDVQKKEVVLFLTPYHMSSYNLSIQVYTTTLKIHLFFLLMKFV